jgi:hypothetical protein
VLKACEGDKCFQFQRFLQFVPVIGSRELEGETGPKEELVLEETREIYLLEGVLQVSAAMVTSELR